LIPDEVRAAVQQHPYPLLFATVSGAHLYGFASVDSDWDLRGVHILPAQDVLGLVSLNETIEVSRNENIELDFVTHDARKFFGLLLKPNGYVLEQLYSPIVVQSTPEHDELKGLATTCVTRHHVHHYLGFADHQWELFRKENPPRLKPLLYVFRVLLTGIHLMRTKEIEANLRHLNEIYGLPLLPELIERKVTGVERQILNIKEIAFYEAEFAKLRAQLLRESEQTSLPDVSNARAALHDLLIRLRLKTMPDSIGPKYLRTT
jgi:hypothetical protein